MTEELIVELIGYCGTGLTVIAYAMKTSIRLRVAGILSSVAFLVYGYMTGSYPVMVMEMILLPLNALRLAEMVRLVRAVPRGGDGDAAPLDWLVPHMAMRRLVAGSFLFHEGDAADCFYVLVSGDLVCHGSGRPIPRGSFVGDAVLFDVARRQSSTVVAQNNVVVATLPQSVLRELYFQNPAFGYRLVECVIGDLRARLDATSA